MKVLGINAAFHESAALVVDGKVVSAREEERFTGQTRQAIAGRKSARASRVCDPFLSPPKSTGAYSFGPELRRAQYQPEWWPDGGMEAQFLRCLGEVGTSADRILERKLGGALKFVPYPSPMVLRPFIPRASTRPRSW